MGLLFEDLIQSCVRFLKANPWTEEEEARVISLVPLSTADECSNLLAGVLHSGNSCMEMLHWLILIVINNHSNMALQGYEGVPGGVLQSKLLGLMF